MKRTPTQKIRNTRFKLRALAERGINGERDAAILKLKRLEARFDFDKPEAQPENLFSGKFSRSSTAIFLTSFSSAEISLASFVKWSLEKGTGIKGFWRTFGSHDSALWVEATRASIPGLENIVTEIREAFALLWQNFSTTPAARPSDRESFWLGLYDGMMQEQLQAGNGLPRSYTLKPRAFRKKKAAVAHAPGVAIHPYSVALGLGQKIRLRMPSGEIVAELREAVGQIQDEGVAA